VAVEAGNPLDLDADKGWNLMGCDPEKFHSISIEG